MATEAGKRVSISAGRVRRTRGSGARTGVSHTMSGWLARTSRGVPHVGSIPAQSRSTSSRGPKSDELRRVLRRARDAKASAASPAASTGTMLAPTQHSDTRSEPS
jgi:hypothetical protein